MEDQGDREGIITEATMHRHRITTIITEDITVDVWDAAYML